MSVGVKNESSLHRILKLHYAGSGGTTETPVGGFFADGVRADGEYIEIQTGSFGPLKKKAGEFAAKGKVRIVHPIPASKMLEICDAAGNLLSKRKSPRQCTPWNLFDALVYAPELPLNPGVIVEILMVEIVEKRVNDGTGSRRRKGVRIAGKDITAFMERIVLEKPRDYLFFTPFAPEEEFTVKMLARRAGIKTQTAQKTLYTLAKMGVVRRVGKKGNEIICGIAGTKE